LVIAVGFQLFKHERVVAHRHRHHVVDERRLEVQARLRHAHQLAVAQHHAALALIDLEPGIESQEQDQQKQHRRDQRDLETTRLYGTNRLDHLDICRLHFESLSDFERLRSESTAAMPRASK
jgi:hypothetical protein